MRRLAPLLAVLSLVAALAGACGSDQPAPAARTADLHGTTLRVVTHDSFAVSQDVLAAFESDTGMKVEILRSGDAGAALNQAILTKAHPLGDVFFGVDNTFLGRALDAGIFSPYEPRRLDRVPAAFRLDPEHRVTPIDHGDVCLNYDKSAFAAGGAPSDLSSLLRPALKGKTVVENPATSSPGLAFLLATVAQFGEGGWQRYWKDLAANDVKVEAGWEEAYYGAFSGGSGEGDRPVVVSYATSPPAEVYFADPQPAEAPTAVVTDGCFRQIEFAGVLDGAANPAGAEAFVDFLLSDRLQADIPLQMFVLPVIEGVTLPDVFVEHAATIDRPLQLTPAAIAANRDRWIKEWTSIVLG